VIAVIKLCLASINISDAMLFEGATFAVAVAEICFHTLYRLVDGVGL
jgi:hypothetical protein